MDDVLALAKVFWRQEALAAGVSRHRLARLADQGHLIRVGRGLYAVAGGWEVTPPWERTRSLALAAGRGVGDAAVSHVSAVALEGLPLPWAVQPHAHTTTLSSARSGSEPDWLTIHRGDLPPRHLMTSGSPHGSVVLTQPPRTVLDAMRILREHDALAVADAALRRGLVQPRDLWAVRREQVHWRGVQSAAYALTLTDPRRENWLESASASLLHSCGLPLSMPQVDVFDRYGEWLARVDGYWADWGVAGEADGRGKYLDDLDGTGADVEAVRRRVVASATREARVRETGIAVVRWEPAEVVHAPMAVARRVRAAAAATDPGQITARLRCSCCGHPLSECGFDRFAPVLKPVSPVKLARRQG